MSRGPCLAANTNEQSLTCWRSVLRHAQRKLEAATGRTTLNAAAQKLMHAKAPLKALGPKRPSRRPAGETLPALGCGPV